MELWVSSDRLASRSVLLIGLAHRSVGRVARPKSVFTVTLLVRC